jgi:O-antigen chain-terminating methyltransferase
MDTKETTNTAAPELDLDELMQRIRAEVTERKKQSEAAPPRPKSEARTTDFAARRFTARELLTLPTSEFTRAAYLAFLGREPLPDEFVRLRDRLLVNHVGRMRILREFHASASARHVEGFWQESLKDRLYWSPPAKFGRGFARLIANICNSPRWLREFFARVELLERRSAESAAAARAMQSAQNADRQNALKNANQTREQLVATRQALDNAIGALERRVAGLKQEGAGIATRLGETVTLLARARKDQEDHWRAIVNQKLILESVLAAERSPSTGNLSQTATGDSHLLDALYLSFEDRYRGTREDIKNRQRVYLEQIEECVAATGNGAVIDIGCGRGEWLELLGEVAIEAHGYDLNRMAVEESHARGLDVRFADAIEALSALPDNSCSAITGFHIIEHLPFEILVRLIDHALRVLRPGGILIVETPNPANLVVAAEKFYFDPTHRNPLPSELTSYLLQSRGFGSVEIRPLHPVGGHASRNYDDPMLLFLQDKLFGAQDYAALARKNP